MYRLYPWNVYMKWHEKTYFKYLISRNLYGRIGSPYLFPGRAVATRNASKKICAALLAL